MWEKFIDSLYFENNVDFSEYEEDENVVSD